MKWIIFAISIGIILIYQFSLQKGEHQKSINPVQNIISNPVSPSPFEYIVITTTPIPTNTPKPTRTGTPTPTPTVHVITSDQINDLFTKYSNLYSVSRDLLWKIAVCESHVNPFALNGIYGGMFQFSASSWIAMRKMMNIPDNPALRFDPEEAIKTAAFKLSVGGIGAWSNCIKQ